MAHQIISESEDDKISPIKHENKKIQINQHHLKQYSILVILFKFWVDGKFFGNLLFAYAQNKGAAQLLSILPG